MHMCEAIKISVIVPIYGVEKYIEKCIRSLSEQTWHNMEILLVDDGSKDRSGQICDEWAEKDARIRVLHIENGGQSHARNVGLEAATGDYIGFVDGDDAARPEMYETMLRLMLENEAEVVECNFVGRKAQEPDLMEDGKILVMDGKTAIRKQLDPQMSSRYPSTSLWSKLFDARILKGLCLPEGMIHEEYAYLCQAFLRCRKYLYQNVRLYERTLREDSTTAAAFSRRAFDKLKVFRMRNEFLLNVGESELYRLSRAQEFDLMIYLYMQGWKAGYWDLTGQLEKEMQKNKEEILNSPMRNGRKREYQLFFLCPWGYRVLWRVKNRGLMDRFVEYRKDTENVQRETTYKQI